MKKTFYWDTAVQCYDYKIEGNEGFATWTSELYWETHSNVYLGGYQIGDTQVPDTCLILQQIPIEDDDL